MLYEVITDASVTDDAGGGMIEQNAGPADLPRRHRLFGYEEHRILLMVGDNFGDFLDSYKGT